MLSNEDVERITDELVGKLLQEMRTVAAGFQVSHPETFPRQLVLMSILWTRLSQKLLKALDDVRHEHMLTMRGLVENGK